MQAHDIQIEWDEGGCYLDATIDESQWEWVEGSTVRLRVTDPEQLYDRVKAAIGPWLREREEAFAEFRQAVRSGTGPADAFLCNPDESGGMDERVVAIREDGSYRVEPDEDPYDPTDPKHPDYHDAMSDLWDSRDKTAGDWPETEGPTGIAGFRSGRYS